MLSARAFRAGEYFAGNGQLWVSRKNRCGIARLDCIKVDVIQKIDQLLRLVVETAA